MTAGTEAETGRAHSLSVVLGADTYPPNVNGAAVFAHRLATALAAAGHRVHVVAPAAGDGAGDVEVDGHVVHRVPSVRISRRPPFHVAVPLGATRRAGRLLEDVRPDVVHVQSHFVVGRALLAAAHGLGLPSLATNHFMPDNLLGYLPLRGRVRERSAAAAWRDMARVFERAQMVTTPTHTALDLIRTAGVAAASSGVVSCGVDLERFSALGRALPLPVPPGRAVLGFVGRLDRDKYLDELIHAVAALPGGPHLVVAGQGTRAHALRAVARGAGVADRIHFVGHVPDGDLPALYRAFDVFMMPGRAELQSLATLEAMACGVPVVAADTGALHHLVINGHTGLRYPPGDIDGLAETIEKIVGNRTMLIRYGRRAQEVATAHAFEWTMQAYVRHYLCLLANRPIFRQS